MIFYTVKVGDDVAGKGSSKTKDIFRASDGPNPPETAKDVEDSEFGDVMLETVQDILDSAAQTLVSQVPSAPESNIPNQKNESDRIIKQANDKAINAQSSIIGLITESERSRLEKQKPVLSWVIAFVGSQLFVFNALIAFTIIFSAIKNPNNENFLIIFEFLKYYIGAVLLELIGMIVFITKSTFTSSTKEMLNIVKSWPNKKIEE